MSSTEIVAPRVESMLPIDSGTARQLMNAYLETTRAMLSADDWIGKPGEPESFVKKSGWDKIAQAYRLSTEVLSETIERDDDGNAIRAHAVVRAIDTTGRYRDGAGGCGINEPRFRQASGRQKVEHDLPATAETRATNRAISRLVGFGQVSAEEVDADVRAGAGAVVAEPPSWASYAPDSDVMAAAAQLVQIVEAANGNTAAVTQVGAGIREFCDGGVPQCVVIAIAGIHAAIAAPAPPSTADENGGEAR